MEGERACQALGAASTYKGPKVGKLVEAEFGSERRSPSPSGWATIRKDRSNNLRP